MCVTALVPAFYWGDAKSNGGIRQDIFFDENFRQN
jgi:hypothetical protein